MRQVQDKIMLSSRRGKLNNFKASRLSSRTSLIDHDEGHEMIKLKLTYCHFVETMGTFLGIDYPNTVILLSYCYLFWTHLPIEVILPLWHSGAYARAI